MISFDKALKSNELLFYIFSSDKYLLEKCNNKRYRRYWQRNDINDKENDKYINIYK